MESRRIGWLSSSRYGVKLFALIYIALWCIAAMVVVLSIQPADGVESTWIERMLPDEVRLLLIAAIGGILGASSRAVAIIAATPSENPSIESDPISVILRGLIAFLTAGAVFLILRSFVLVPTAPVYLFNPLGVLVVGVVIGVIIDASMPTLASHLNNFALESKLDRIGEAVGASILDNYHGQVRVQILRGSWDRRDRSDMHLREERVIDRLVQLTPNHKYTLVAWFEPRSSGDVGAEHISISGGNDVRQIAFTIVADSSAEIGFVPGIHHCNFNPKDSSEEVGFEFVAPLTEVPFTIWLRVTQKGRLSAVMAVQVVSRPLQLASDR